MPAAVKLVRTSAQSEQGGTGALLKAFGQFTELLAENPVAVPLVNMYGANGEMENGSEETCVTAYEENLTKPT